MKTAVRKKTVYTTRKPRKKSRFSTQPRMSDELSQAELDELLAACNDNEVLNHNEDFLLSAFGSACSLVGELISYREKTGYSPVWMSTESAKKQAEKLRDYLGRIIFIRRQYKRINQPT